MTGRHSEKNDTRSGHSGNDLVILYCRKQRRGGATARRGERPAAGHFRVGYRVRRTDVTHKRAWGRRDECFDGSFASWSPDTTAAAATASCRLSLCIYSATRNTPFVPKKQDRLCCDRRTSKSCRLVGDQDALFWRFFAFFARSFFLRLLFVAPSPRTG